MTRHNRLSLTGLALAPTLITAALACAFASGASAAPPAGSPDLGAAKAFSVLGSTTVTNTGPTVLPANLGVSTGTAITGFPPGIVTPPGTINRDNGVARTAKANALTAYNTAAASPSTETEAPGSDLVGRTLPGGTYTFASAMKVSGTLTLNGQGNPDTVWVFQAGSTLTAASDTNIALINGASACNVYWQVGSSATIGTTASTDTTRKFRGNILANQSVTVNNGTRVEGRVFALNGAVTLQNNVFTAPNCDTGNGGGTGGGGAGGSTTPTPTSTPTPGSGGSGGGGGPSTPGGKSSTPTPSSTPHRSGSTPSPSRTPSPGNGAPRVSRSASPSAPAPSTSAPATPPTRVDSGQGVPTSSPTARYLFLLSGLFLLLGVSFLILRGRRFRSATGVHRS